MYKQAASHPAAFGHRLTPLLFCRAGAKYKIYVSRLFLAVLAFVTPLLNRFLGIVYIVLVFRGLKRINGAGLNGLNFAGAKLV